MKLPNMSYEAFPSPLCVHHTVHVTEASSKMFYAPNGSKKVFPDHIRSVQHVTGETGGRCRTEGNRTWTWGRSEGVKREGRKRWMEKKYTVCKLLRSLVCTELQTNYKF